MPLRRSVADIVGAVAAFASCARAGGASVRPVNSRAPNETAIVCRFMICRPFRPGLTRTVTEVIIGTADAAPVSPRNAAILRSNPRRSDMDDGGTQGATFPEQGRPGARFIARARAGG